MSLILKKQESFNCNNVHSTYRLTAVTLNWEQSLKQGFREKYTVISVNRNLIRFVSSNLYPFCSDFPLPLLSFSRDLKKFALLFLLCARINRAYGQFSLCFPRTCYAWCKGRLLPITLVYKAFPHSAASEKFRKNVVSQSPTAGLKKTLIYCFLHNSWFHFISSLVWIIWI